MKDAPLKNVKLYVSYGMTKCGSTLAFKLTRRLFVANGLPQGPLPEEINGPKHSNFVQHLDDEVTPRLVAHVEERGAPVVVKTHTPPGAAAAELLRAKQAIGHVVFRDPREMALSMLDHGERSRRAGRFAFTHLEELEDTIERIENQIGYLEQWLRLPGMMPWYYDDFAFDHLRAIRRLQFQTGLGGDPATMLSRFDATTGMQFNKGLPERWRTDMSEEDSATFLKRFAPFYKRMIGRRRAWRQPFLGRRETLRLGARATT